MTQCNREGCRNSAHTAIGVAIYPHEAMMRFYRSAKPLTTMTIGLALCDKHFAEAAAGPVAEFLPEETLNPIIEMCERSSGASVDRAATKLVRVALDSPMFLRLLAGREKAPDV